MHKWEKLDELGHAWRMPVPGGWLYSIEVAKFDCGSAPYPPTYGGGVVFIPDPTAPHCQPAQTPVGPPPMTDDELIAWLTATYGEPRPIGGLMWWDLDPDSSRAAWHNPGQPKETDCWGLVDAAGFTTLTCPAHIAGPALWAAHHFGGTP
jgi:hypothetical protein